MEFEVEDKCKLREHLKKELEKNPFLTEDDIYGILKKQMSADLDGEMDEFVNADDYYEPYFEEFVSEGCYGAREKWESWGLEIMGFEGTGEMEY